MDQSSGKSEIEQLERLTKLHSEGALSDEEFGQLKAKLLGHGSNTQHRSDYSTPRSEPNNSPSPAIPDQDSPVTRFDPDITLTVVISWAWSVFFAILGGTMLLAGHAGAGLCAIVSALIVFPPLEEIILSRWGISSPTVLRFLVALVLVFATGHLLGLTLENLTPPATQTPDAQPTPTQETNTTGGQASNTIDNTAPEKPAPPPASEVQPGDAPAQQLPGAQQNVETVDSVMGPRFGNTVISRSDTTEWHLYFNSDHTFTGREIRTNYRVAGTWHIADSNLCMAFQPPLAGTSDPNCKPISAHQLGDNWTVDQSLFTLVEGIQ